MRGFFHIQNPFPQRFDPILSLLSSGVHFVSERDFLQEKLVLFGEIICFWNIAVKIERNQIVELLLSLSLIASNPLDNVSRRYVFFFFPFVRFSCHVVNPVVGKRDLLKPNSHLRDELFFSQIPLSTFSILFRATIIAIQTAMTFCPLRGYHSSALATTKKSGKWKIVMFL
ncbi:hypothetical protein AUJ44_04525 [Candidatus Nomurabacteria bacterium CG1_02_47_685]|uniref:Uncharacterized protein n=1 Tax=Candidatus Nomurabacteria bacterium CG1_02_47_685 TaxID=1805282 RepID=A0A1J4VAT2_9BACT|nr:MAG: hypothetical protein AUJ44_04525 [Candidatus Nomurabacteria bacterium CG1_02_47_685]